MRIYDDPSEGSELLYEFAWVVVRMRCSRCVVSWSDCAR